ncbi:MAG: 30S ribosome-binding factor RbfA [Armatimonadota bacterium]
MSTRQEKIQGLIKVEVSEILQREFKDPRLGFITVIDVEVSPDLRHARIFVSVMGSEEERKANMAVLNKARHFVRQALGKRMHMKTLPEIEFRLDTSADKSIKIFELLEEIKHDDEKLS